MSTSMTKSDARAWSRIGAAASFAGRGPFAVSAGGFDVVLVNTASGWHAYQGRCPHQGALLGEGELSGDVLVCRNHGWRFDTQSGQRHGGPQCLTQCAVELRGADLYVDSALLQDQRTAVLSARRTLDDVPGPRPLPLLGNILQLEQRRLHLVLEEWAHKYGPLYTYRMGPKRVLGIADPALNEQVLRDRPETYRRASVVEPVFAEMGVSGVFSAEGIAWRPQRRLAMQALSLRQQREFYASLHMIAGRLRRRWLQLADAGEEVDVVEEMKRFTVDVTTLFVFGHDVNTIERGNDFIQKNLELVFPTFSRRLFALLPTWRWLRMPADRRVDRALAELRGWLGDRISEARQRIAADPSRMDNPANFIEAMLTARDADGHPFSDDVIFGNAMTMLLAGEDTTAFTLAWAIHHLCETPHAVAQLRAEGHGLLDHECLPPDMDRALGLEYAGAVANEAMRLRPVAPILFLENTRDVVIGDVAVPAGTWLGLLTRPAVLQDTRFAAAHEFRPERWLGEHPEARHDAGAHMPFGSGPRICPGRSLALLEMKLLLSMLSNCFDIEHLNRDVTEVFAFTMTPVGITVRLSRHYP